MLLKFTHAEVAVQSNNAHNPLFAISEVTGGTSRIVNTMKAMQQYMEDIVNTMNVPTVCINFEPLKTQPMNKKEEIMVPSSTHTNVAIRTHTGGFWPIPENYFPSHGITTLVCLNICNIFR